MMAESQSILLGSIVQCFRSSWTTLVLTDIAFKLLAFIVLTPLVGLLMRGLLAASGNAVLSDIDILWFFLGPWGWLCLIVVGAVWLGIVALEQTALIAIVYAANAQERLRPLIALRFTFTKAWPVIQVTARIVAFTLFLIAPFLAVAAGVYLLLLTEYDINYYLKEKPAAFQIALGIGGLLAVTLVALLLRLWTSWFVALPLVVFEDVRPAQALRVSTRRVDGHRRTILIWIVGWFVATTVLSGLATSAVGLLGRWLVNYSTASLHLMATSIGIVMLLGAGVGLVVNLLSTTTFAVMLFQLYKAIGRDEDSDNVPLSVFKGDAERAAILITRRRLTGAAIVGLVVAIAIGVSTLRSVRLADDVQIMAHRGSSSVAPENTLASIRQAIEDGAEWVEIDVQETKDGEVVVLHDSDFMKLAGRNLKIWDATLDDLRDIDIGSWLDPQFKDERIPTLAQVLEMCRGRIGVIIELKYYGRDQQLEQRVVDIVESHDMAREVMVMSLKMAGIRKFQAIRPDWKVGLLMSVSAGSVKNIDVDFLAVNASFANRNLIQRTHDSGKEIYVWTVNDAPTMSMLISRGVDGILTDKPALARSVLAQRAEMSVPERLLLEAAGVLGTSPEFGDQ